MYNIYWYVCRIEREYLFSITVEKPRITETPKDIVAKENSNVVFHCRASGDPEPTLIWKKSEGQIAAERSVDGGRNRRTELARHLRKRFRRFPFIIAIS